MYMFELFETFPKNKIIHSTCVYLHVYFYLGHFVPTLNSAYASLMSARVWDFAILGPDIIWKYASVGEWSSSSLGVILWAFLFLGDFDLGGPSRLRAESFVSLVRQATAKYPVLRHFPQVFPFAGHSPL